MARVVSWRVDIGSTKYYAYITDTSGAEPLISNSQLSQLDANRIGSIVLEWSKDAYIDHFNEMQNALDSRVGEHVDLGQANKYWNITEYETPDPDTGERHKEVLMLVGADGKNTSEELSSYYTFHLVNQAIAIGTGDNYILDKDADIYMEAFFMDRNGNKYSCNDRIEVEDANFVVSNPSHGESTTFTLTIKSGTTFSAADTRSIECIIHGRRNLGDGNYAEGKAVFTITAVLGGKEGVSYDLIVAPKQFHFNSPQEVATSTGKVNVGVLMNGKMLNGTQMSAEHLSIGYEYSPNGQNGFYDEEDIEPATVDGNGKFQISPLSIYNNGGTVAFYLIYSDEHGNIVVDSDSASVVVDGEDGLGTVTIELDNEVEAIGVGDDSDLDLPNGISVTASTNVRMYSGETSLIIEDIDVIDATVNAGKGTYWDEYPIVADDMVDGNGDYYGTIRIVLGNGFEFGDDLRDKITLNVTGRHPGSSTMTVTKSCAFTILGIKGGKDGVIFRLTPSCDYIMYDPNAGLIQCEASEPFPVSEIGNKKISAVATQGNYYKNPSEIAADNERVTYSIGVTHSSAQMAYGASTPGIDGRNFTAPLSEVMGDMTNPTSRYITFYWTKQIGSEIYLIDRETVPVISAGLDGKFAKIELGNEVDAITIGDDTKLDIGDLDTVEVGTSIRAVGGDLTDLDITAVRADVIQDFDGWHSDSENWPAVQLEVSDDNGTNWSAVDGEPHKKWRFWYDLPNGFDFGEDKKEKIKLDVTYKLEDETEHTGSAIFTIVGVPGGKEGQRYQLVPEVDIVRYFANDDMFDEETLICDATIGLERLETGHIYYGERVKTEQGYRVLDIISPTFKNEYVESNSVQVRDMYFGQNPNFSGPTNQIAWYLTIDTDEGELIVDHETVSIVADGKDGDPNIKVELSNEIESVATGTDTSLGDMQNNEYVTARTDVYVVRGSSEKIEICGFSSQWLDTVESNWLKNAPKLYKRSAEDSTVYEGEISASNRGKYTTLEVLLNRNFDFGADMRKRLILILSYKDAITEEVKTVRGLFTLIAVKGGKDGMVFKIQPTPDFIGFDLQTQEWAGGTSQVSAYAFLNGNRLSQTKKPGTSENYREGRDYEVKITRGVVYDLDSAAQQWNTGVFSNYTEGAGVGFSDPSATAREQSIVFYLKFGDKVVDRESVPLYINGKEGKDGAGSLIFDLSNENWVVTTGDDAQLNIDNNITGGTYVTCSSGSTYASIHVDIECPYRYGTSSFVNDWKVELIDNDTPKVQIKVTLRSGFQYDPDTLRREISIHCSTLLDGFSGDLVFALVGVKNGHNGKEGVSYQIKTTAGSIVYDTNTKQYVPTQFDARLYEGMENVSASFTVTVTDESGAVVGQDTDSGLYTRLRVSDYVNFPSIGFVNITATTSNGGWDSANIPIVPSGKDGSGIVFDLTNDRDTIALGSDLILDTNVNLGDTAVGTMWQGSTQLAITNCSATVMNFAQSSKVHASARVEGGNSVVLSISVDSGLNFGILEGNQVSITISATGTSVDSETVSKDVKYTIHGFQGGEDGHVYRILPSCNVIKYNSAENRYVPTGISATFTDNGVATSRYYMKLTMDLDDEGQITPVEYNEGDVLSVSDLVTVSGLNNFVVFYAYDAAENGNLIDKEAVPIVYDGHDGEGGLVAQVSPSSIFIQSTAGRPTTQNEYFALVSLWSGSTQDTIKSVKLSGTTLSTSYTTVQLGSKGTVRAKIETPNEVGTLYKRMIIEVPTSLDISLPIQMMVAVQSNSDSTQTRYASFTLDPNQGGKGDQGPKTRMRDWAADTEYLNGEGGDEFWDYVYYDGSYYGCLEDHTSTSSEPPSASCYTYGEEPVAGKKWVKYSGATFTASRIAFFGDGSSGWTIDTKKIEHTTKSITLNGDTAAMEIRNVSPVYKYTKGSSEIYTNLDLKSAELFAQYFGNPVPVYQDLALTQEVGGTYLLQGTRTSPQLVKPSLINVPVTVVGLGTNNYLRANISSELGFDLTATFNYDVFTTTGNKTTYSDGSVMYSTSIRQYTYTNNSVIPAGDKNGSASPTQIGTTGYTSINQIDYTSPSGFWNQKFNYSPYGASLGAKNSSNFEDSEGGEIRMRSPRAQEYNSDCREEFQPIVDDDEIFCRFEVLDCDSECSSDSTYPTDTVTKTDKFVRINSITFSGNPNSYYPYYSGHTVSNMQDAYGFSNGTVNGIIAPASVTTEVYSNPVTINPQDNETLPLTAVINGNVKSGSEYGDIVIAAGIDGTEKMVQSWTCSGEDPIFTIGDPPTGGTPFTIYVGSEMPFEATATRLTNVISYNGHSYSKSGSLVSTNATKFAKSRIYKDGSIITSRLFASDGSFNGVINADRGNFTGGLNASNCKITDAQIEDSFFKGTVVAPMGGSLTAEYSANKPMFVASPMDVTEGSVLYALPSFTRQDSGSWLGLGTKTNTNVDYWLLSGVTTSNGSTIKIPSFTVTVSGKKIKSCVIKLVFTGVNSIGSSGTVNLYNDPNGNRDTGGSGAFSGGTYTTNGSEIKIKIVYSFSIGGGSGKISMSGKFGGQIEIGKTMDSPYYVFGSNGMYLTDGYYGTISMVKYNGLSIRYKGSKTNEIFFNSNGGMFLNTVSGGYKYSLDMSRFIIEVSGGASVTNMRNYITKTSV